MPDPAHDDSSPTVPQKPSQGSASPTMDGQAASTPNPRADLSVADPDGTRAYQPGLDVTRAVPAVRRSAPRPQVPGYILEGELGRGGMGIVYKARHLALKRPVALKMILTGAHAGEEEVVRFKAEAEAVARLQHPNIVQVYEVGEYDGLPFLALELVEGGSLAQRLRGQPLPPREVAQLVEALARAMQLAHSRNIVHRDLKPANVLLAADGTPKVTDFGLARQLDADSNQTRSGAIVGTPAYMAPEQAYGQVRATGPAADVYALGVILYECLTGRQPFKGASALETLEQVRTQEPPAPQTVNPNLPRDLATIALKCIRKEPERRYASADALADDLHRWQAGEPIRARPVGTAERAVKWVRRNPVVAALLALVALALAGGAVGIELKYLDAREQEGIAKQQRALAEAETAEKVKEAQAKDEAIHAKDEAMQAKDNALQAEREAVHEKELANQKLQAELANNKVQLAQNAWDKGDVVLAREILGQVRPPFRRWEWHYLRRFYEGGICTLYGHNSGVFAVAFSPDGTRLATGGADRTVRLWDARTGAFLLELKGHGGAVHGVAFNADGTRLATASQDGMARLWNTQTAAVVREFKGHRDGVLGVALSPDGTRLATASQDGTARLWNAQTGAVVREFVGHRGLVLGVAFSPDGTRLATAGEDTTARVWDVQTGEARLKLEGHKSALTSVAFSPDGLRLATASADSTARLWDAQTGTLQQELHGHANAVRCAAFSPDGARLVTGGLDKSVRVWDARTGAPRLELRGHSGQVAGVAFSPNGTQLASAGHDQTARLWDARADGALLTLRGHPGYLVGVAYSADGAYLATACSDWTARLWDAHTGIALGEFQGHTDMVHAVALGPDGTRLATASQDWTARLWDTRNRLALQVLKGHKGPVRGVAFSPDGRYVATASWDRTARLWDALTGTPLLEFKGHARELSGVAFSPDGSCLATTCHDGTARLWDARTGTVLVELRGHVGPVYALAFSPDGTTLATAGSDRTARLWEAHTGAVLAELKGHTAVLTGVAFSADGTRLATTSHDQTARLWDARTGAALLELKGHASIVGGVAFSPDGTRLATVSADRTARLWYAAPLATEKEFTGELNSVSDAAFSPDGTRLTTWDRMRGVVTWDVATGRLLPEAAPANHASGPRSPDGRWLALIEATGVRLVDLGQPKGDELDYRQWATRPDPLWHLEQADRCFRDGQGFAASFHLDRTEGVLPTPHWLAQRGNLAAQLGRWPRAQADFAAVCEQIPWEVIAWRRLALTQLAGGQADAYRRTCAQLRGRFGTAPQSALAGLLFAFPADYACAAVLLPRLTPETCSPQAIVTRAEVAATCMLTLEGAAESPELLSLTYASPLARAAVLCRAGRYDEAATLLAERDSAVPLLWLALAESGRNRPDEARQALNQAAQWLAAPRHDEPTRTNLERLPWEERLEADLLRKEVQARLPEDKK